jgi:hypothetical protein
MEDNIKKDMLLAIMIAHNNTHSTSRIFRNVELISKETDPIIIEKRLKAIEEATRECRQQVDELYKLIKNK